MGFESAFRERIESLRRNIMELLDLPPELFAGICHALVTEVAAAEAFKYRTVCRTFAATIYHDVANVQSLSDHSSKLPTKLLYRLLVSLGGPILGREVPKQENALTQFASNLVDAVLELEGPQSEPKRKQYTEDICTVICGSTYHTKAQIWPFFESLHLAPQNPASMFSYHTMTRKKTRKILPIAIAAVGDIELFSILSPSLKEIESADVHTPCFFPSALCAAVATGKIKIVRNILIRIMDDIKLAPKGRLRGYYVHPIRKLRVLIWDAIRVAITRLQTEIGNMLFDFLDAEPDLNHEASYLQFEPDVLRICIEYGEFDLFYRVLDYSRTNIQPAEKQTSKATAGLTKLEAELLFKHASSTFLRRFLKDKFLNLNHCGDTTPLTMAIEYRRYGLARILIEHGAKVDAIPKDGKPVTALWYAAKAGNLETVRLLLEHGADPECRGDWRSPLQAVLRRGWRDVAFLLSEAKWHGNAAALGQTTMARYGKSKYEGQVVCVIDP